MKENRFLLKIHESYDNPQKQWKTQITQMTKDVLHIHKYIC